MLPLTNMVAMETSPQVTMRKAIQIFAPMRCRMRLLGKPQERVADEEEARAHGVGAFGDALGGGQRLLGEADVGAVKERDHVHEHEPGREAAHDAREGTLERLAVGGRGCRAVRGALFSAWKARAVAPAEQATGRA